jgi:hypothetical protein
MVFWGIVILLFNLLCDKLGAFVAISDSGRKLIAALIIVAIIIWALYAFGLIPYHGHTIE